MEDWEDHIFIDERVMAGKPIIRYTRLAVEHILDLLKRGWTHEQILREYPGITAHDVIACVAYGTEVQEARRALDEAKKQGSIPFEDIKKEFGS